MESGPVLWLEGEGQSSLDSAAAAEHVAPQVGQPVMKKRCVWRGGGGWGGLTCLSLFLNPSVAVGSRGPSFLRGEVCVMVAQEGG